MALNHLSSQKGFSIVTTLVAVGISSIVAMGFASIFQDVSKNNQIAQAKVNYLSLQSFIKDQLQVPTICSNVLRPASTITVGGGSTATVQSGTLTIGANTFPRGYPGVEVTSLSISNIRDVWTNPNGRPVRSGDLIIGARNNAGTTFARQTVATVYLEVDGTDHMTSCTSVNIPASCQAMGGRLLPNGSCDMLTNADPQILCTKVGGTFVEGRCQMAPPLDASALCTTLGGSLNNGKCETVAALDGAAMCSKLGGSFKSGKCALGGGGGGGSSITCKQQCQVHEGCWTQCCDSVSKNCWYN